MKPILLAIAVLFSFSIAPNCDAQLLRRDRPVAVGINWDAGCAVESALQFAMCRKNGGGYFSCTVNAGLSYWQCSGSTFQTSFRPANRVRAYMVGQRVLRRSR